MKQIAATPSDAAVASVASEILQSCRIDVQGSLLSCTLPIAARESGFMSVPRALV